MGDGALGHGHGLSRPPVARGPWWGPAQARTLGGHTMLTREDVRRLGLEAKGRLGLTWPQLGEAVGRSPVYAALLVYGYGQATTEEAEALVRTLALPEEAKGVLGQAPHRTPA